MKQAKADSFGYSDTRLWYAMTVFCGAVLILIPVIGSFWAFTLLTIPAYSICKNAAKRYTKTYAEIWQECAEYEASVAKILNYDPFTLLPTLPKPRIYKDLRGMVKTTTKQPRTV